MNRYRIKKQKSFWAELFEGPEYLSGFDFKDEYDYRPAEGSYWSFFLIFNGDKGLSIARDLAKKYEGVIVSLSQHEYDNLVAL